MKIPTHTMVDNLRFTRSGQVWADYLITGIPYGLRPVKEKRMVRQLHQGLIRALPGESLWLSLASGLDPAGLVSRMLEGVDRDQYPDWAAECDATLDSLADLRPGQRILWLSIPLPTPPNESTARAMREGLNGVKEMVAWPRVLPEKAEVDRFRERARAAVESIPHPFAPRPATPAQMVWLHLHMLDRGLYLDWNLPDGPDSDVVTAVKASKRASALPEPYLDEGGKTDLAKGTWSNPLTRRFLKVQNTALGTQEEASYQSLLVVSDVPDGGMVFPGSEMLGRIDESGMDVDWAVRLRVKASREVLQANTRALRNLNEQFDQRDGAADHGVFGLQVAANDLQEYAGILETDKLEVETSSTMIFCVSGSTMEAATLQATALGDYLANDAHYKLAQPVGYQEDLWWAMHPGVPTSAVVREYAQITTSAAFSTLVPFASTALGDSKGILLALNTGHGPMLDDGVTCGPAGMVFIDPQGATDKNKSGSLAIVGDLGSGKSFTLKKITGAILDMGGRVIIPDRTAMGEWALWASSVTDARIVDVDAPRISLDPLRLFDTSTGSRIAQSFLTLLINVSPTSDLGVALSESLEPEYLRRHQLSSLGEVLDHLLSVDCRIEGAQALAGKINVFARRSLGRVVFDSQLPALQLKDPAIIIRTASLQMPSQNELTQQHLFAQLTLEKIFGRAFYALVSAVAQHICFQDRGQLAAFVVDEAHFITNNEVGVQTATDFVRDGRKHRAILALGSHDAQDDFPSKVLRGLIPNKLLMRHTDPDLARRGLEFIGLDPSDDSLVDLVTKNTSPEIDDDVPEFRRGEGILRDAAGRIGRVKVLAPALKARNQAARTGGKKDLVA